MNKAQCFLCGSTDTKFLLESFNLHGRHLLDKKKAFKIFRCLKCGSIFVGGVEINDQYYKKYYPVDYYDESTSGKKLINLALGFLDKFSLKRKQKFILKNVKSKDKKLKILDVGCGGGNFLSGLDSSLFEKYGVEINKKGYKRCLEKGFKVYNQELTDIDFQDKKFDIVTLWHVLEHIEKPMGLLNGINHILKNNGVLILDTPNTNSLGFKYGRENWFHLDSPRHLILYNRKSINWLLKKNKFKIIEVKNEFYDYPFDLFWSIKKSIFRFVIYPFYPTFKLLSREHLTFVCKKNEG